MRIAWSQYSVASSGGPTNAAASASNTTARSCAIGKMAWSLA